MFDRGVYVAQAQEMSIKDLKVHYNKQWQAITDVLPWKYSYSTLIKDIMKKFLPRGADVPIFKIVCEQNGEYLPVTDDESLTRCLLFGESEIDIYVDVEQVSDHVRDVDKGGCASAIFNSEFGYYVEEVEEPEIIVLDSDCEEEVEVDNLMSDGDCGVDEIATNESEGGERENERQNEKGVEGENEGGEKNMGGENGNEVEDEIDVMTHSEDFDEDTVCGESVDEENDAEGDVDSDGQSAEEHENPEDAENQNGREVPCTLSTDEDDEYRGENRQQSDSNTSLEDENAGESVSDDGFSGVESEGERVNFSDEDPEHTMQLELLRKANAGINFSRENDGSIQLRVGHLFKNVYHFREVLREFVIQEGFEMVREKNEKSRVTVSCKGEGCTWRLHASPTPDCKTFKIKTYTSEHSCLRSSKFKDATSAWVAAKLLHKFAAQPNKSKAGIEEDLRSEFGITGLSPMKLFRARQKAKTMLHGDHGMQYAKLRLYGEMVLKYNPGSIFKVTCCERQRVDAPIMFKRMFVMFEGAKKAFLQGCRPFIGIDGCFLKDRYGGILLAAVAIDGNNGVLPLAIGIVEVENRDSWLFFLGLLREAIGDSMDEIQWTFISDRQKVTLNTLSSCNFNLQMPMLNYNTNIFVVLMHVGLD